MVWRIGDVHLLGPKDARDRLRADQQRSSERHRAQRDRDDRAQPGQDAKGVTVLPSDPRRNARRGRLARIAAIRGELYPDRFRYNPIVSFMLDEEARCLHASRDTENEPRVPQMFIDSVG